MKDFLEWAFDLTTPGYVGVVVGFTYFFGFMLWFLLALWLFDSGRPVMGFLWLFVPLGSVWLVVIKEYRNKE